MDPYFPEFPDPSPDDDLNSIYEWPVKDIAYTAIIGAIFVLAFVEWILWLAAFNYCLAKVCKKSETWSTRILAAFMLVTFTLTRFVFLPIIIVTLPLPFRVTEQFPKTLVDILQWFAFGSFSILLTIPWVFCFYQVMMNHVGRNRRIKGGLAHLGDNAPKVVIVMPCYHEPPGILLRAIDSIVDGEYPRACIHLFLSFDGNDMEGTYWAVLERLGCKFQPEQHPQGPSIDVPYRGVRITVSRFAHGGKRHTQKKTFQIVDRIYEKYNEVYDDMFILFIDSDCILDPLCIQNFIWDMALKPGAEKRNMLAMTGVITSTARSTSTSLISLLQDMEYVHGQLFERSVESVCGSVTCLPGALTILRFSAFRTMARLYFADKASQCDDLFDYGKCHLGEDRWLTHLFMVGAQKPYQIGMCTSAFCKTEACSSFKDLIKQRRRWFLGFITNEACMLTDVRLWKQYPILCLMRFLQNTFRTTALMFLIMIIALAANERTIKQLPIAFIGLSLFLNWCLMIYFGCKLRRYKAFLYPVMFVINPFFNWVYMVYGILTAGKRTWGGPRADAGAANNVVTPQDAVEKAEKVLGDDLAVVPETFRQHSVKKESVPLQPANEIRGRFRSKRKGPDGLYHYSTDSLPRLPYVPDDRRRFSFESYISGGVEDHGRGDTFEYPYLVATNSADKNSGGDGGNGYGSPYKDMNYGGATGRSSIRMVPRDADAITPAQTVESYELQALDTTEAQQQQQKQQPQEEEEEVEQPKKNWFRGHHEGFFVERPGYRFDPLATGELQEDMANAEDEPPTPEPSTPPVASPSRKIFSSRRKARGISQLGLLSPAGSDTPMSTNAQNEEDDTNETGGGGGPRIRPDDEERQLSSPILPKITRKLQKKKR